MKPAPLTILYRSSRPIEKLFDEAGSVEDGRRRWNVGLLACGLRKEDGDAREEGAVKKREAESEPFCECAREKGKEYVACECGEEDTEFDWVWDAETKSTATKLSSNLREVKFHQEYSSGTAAIRGTEPLKSGHQYYWEIKMTTPVYGTDMMIGVGTAAAKLDKYRYNFCSFLGSDSESWGLSYTGYIHHSGQYHRYTSKFGQGCIIGVHLDTWNGTLSYFKNRQPLGVAYKNLQGKAVYPMVSSTAARSGMKMIRSCSFTPLLQYLCIRALRNNIPNDVSLTDAYSFPPGMKNFLKNNIDWVIGTSGKPKVAQKRAYQSAGVEENLPVIARKRPRMQSREK